jgi:acyl dehydratase
MAQKELSSSPGMLPMFARAGASMIPLASRLPFIGGGGKDIPDLTLTLNEVRIDPDRLAGYDRVCGFDLSDELPPTYPHMLAFPLQLSLMTDGSFPFPAIGLVHIYNRIVQHRPIRLNETLSIEVTSTKLEPHPRGRQFSLLTEVHSGDELVWEEVSTNLRRGSGGDEEAESPGPPSAEDLPIAATWKLPGDLGRRYGMVSGDLNPIHVHSLTAKLFGFPSAIAHGMWTKARCLAALAPRLPDRFTAEAAFKKPIILPAKVGFAEESISSGIRFGVRHPDKGTPHLDGEVTFN